MAVQRCARRREDARAKKRRVRYGARIAQNLMQRLYRCCAADIRRYAHVAAAHEAPCYVHAALFASGPEPMLSFSSPAHRASPSHAFMVSSSFIADCFLLGARVHGAPEGCLLVIISRPCRYHHSRLDSFGFYKNIFSSTQRANLSSCSSGAADMLMRDRYGEDEQSAVR